MDEVTTQSPGGGGVQSLHRALDILEILMAAGGHMAIGEIATTADLPLPTIHRLLKTLVGRGYVRQLPNRQYALGYRLVPLGLMANTLLGAYAGEALSRLVAELGETANLAILSEDHAEYIAQVPSPHAMRMFTEVGRRVELHSTGVGKALLAQLDARDVAGVVRRIGLRPQTAYTISSAEALAEELQNIRTRGYALDEEEQELGVRCVAVVVPGRLLTPMAISVSGPLVRVTDDFVLRAVPLLKEVARDVSDEISKSLSPGH
ncbi:MAG: transcriptional regulator, IclR family [Subtercola sp.]|nr:transcriptional regulator, IclR family [Subtercola sp.]